MTHVTLAAFVAAAQCVLCACVALADPVYVDLSPVANRSLQDDGVAGNSQGGWSDEGPNDMLVYPPVPYGPMTRNGHHFRIAEPASEDAPTIIMLRGRQLPDLPEQVTVPVDNTTGTYVYVLHSLVRLPPGMDGNAAVAHYTLKYADGTEASFALHAGRHLRHWWTQSWYDNAGADAWPILMGRNAESTKWKHYVGEWATRLDNPHPDKPITGIQLQSLGLAVPASLAITIDSADYHAGGQIKSHYSRPDEPPIGYFDQKLAQQLRQIYQVMVEREMVRGLREVEVIAPDMLAVTLDAWVAQGPGAGTDQAAALQTPEAFQISVNGTNVSPTRVGRLSFEYWNGNIGPFQQQFIYWHTYYLQLDQPIAPGATVNVRIPKIEAPFVGSTEFTFDPAKQITPVIKVNQVAYSARSTRRYAYLGWWAADLGAVNYDRFQQFTVVDEATGRTTPGRIALRADNDPLSGERVYEMDLSRLGPGRYHIRIDSLGRSSSFSVGGEEMAELYRHTNRAYYHQRAGTALEAPYTTFTTPIHHHRVTRSGRVLSDDAPESPDDPSRVFRGGYHDAADFDVFTYHLRATGHTLLAYEMNPNAFGDGDLNIPESGNGIPDILDEAHWALLAYLELQREDGAIPLGRGNEQDAQRDYVRKHGRAPEYGIFPPQASSAAEYAAAAAQYARLIRKYDSERAATYLASAEQAFRWQQAQSERDRDANVLAVWAAAELYATTGKESYHQAFRQLFNDGAYRNIHYTMAQYYPVLMGTYARLPDRAADRSIRDALRKEILSRANDGLRKLDEAPYRVGLGDRHRGYGWGSLNGGGHYANILLLAWNLTGEQRYLDGASLNADFQLGCNPLSKTFITGMGDRPPRHPQIATYLYTGPGKTGQTVKGITVYGLADSNPPWYPTELPPWRRWRDIGNGGAEVSSEFTITETIGASSMLYSTLHALHRQPDARAPRVGTGR